MRILSEACRRATVLLVLMGAGAANAAEIKVLCANGMRDVMEEVGPKFARTTNHQLAIEFGTIGVILQRIDAGESADVIIIPPVGTNRLLANGKGLANTDVLLAHSGIGVAIRKGVPKPDISTPELFRQILLGAKSVTYLDPAAGGTTGDHSIACLLFSRTIKPVQRNTAFQLNQNGARSIRNETARGKQPDGACYGRRRSLLQPRRKK
jgi:molybdate transport system substrate-binding protein